LKPHIVFITTVFDEVATGPAIYAQYLWQAFQGDEEFDFHVVAPYFSLSHPQLHSVGLTKKGWTLYRRVQRTALNLGQLLGGLTIYHGNSAHGMFDFVGHPGPWAVQVNDYEAAFWSHGLQEKVRRHGVRRMASLAWRRWQEKRVVNAACRVICNSGWTCQVVSHAYGANKHRIIQIHKAVDTSRFVRPIDLPPDPVPNRKSGERLAFVGSNWHTKGLDLLLRALFLLLPEFPELTLCVAGAEEMKANARLKEFSHRLGVADSVRFLGRLDSDELSRLLWYSDILVLPSREEAFGVVVLEALASGLPVVAARVGGIPEILQGEDFGVLCEPTELSVAMGIRRVLTDSPYRERLIHNGPARAREFSVERMVDSVRKVYRDLVICACKTL
jgi:glycosyltransferase involved in cell wall biosynthesis